MSVFFALLTKAGGLLARLPAWVYLVLALALWGWHGANQAELARKQAAAQALAASQAATAASEAARKTEQKLTAKVKEISDELQATQAARDAAARDAAKRMRDLAIAKRTSDPGASTAAACSRYEGPPVAIIPDATRDALIDFARDADEVSDQLQACQAYVLTVLNPDKQ